MYVLEPWPHTYHGCTVALGEDAICGPDLHCNEKVASIDELAFRIVVCFGDWKAIPSRFVSPAHLFVPNRRKLPDTCPELGLLQTGKEMPFLECAAQQSVCWHFKGLKISKPLQDKWGLQLDPDASDAELLVQAQCCQGV